MKIVATNIGRPTTFTWKGKEEQTGIFKYPVQTPISLGITDVGGDTVIDRKHHAGTHKACYLFAADNYPYWKGLYPDLDWNWGMFGENLTVQGLDETTMRIGNIYRLGKALVQLSQPREPCYKLGVRFGNQDIVQRFVDHGRPGTYVRILEPGSAETGMSLELVEESANPLTVQQFYQLIYAKNKPQELLQVFMDNPAVPQYKKERFKKFVQKAV